MKNALENCRRELRSRWDFKGAEAEVDWDEKKMECELSAESELHLKQWIEMFKVHLVKQSIALTAVQFSEKWQQEGKKYKERVSLKAGLTKELVKLLVARIRKEHPKVQTQSLGDKLRVTAKSRDFLQAVIQALKQEEWERPLQFTHFRD